MDQLQFISNFSKRFDNANKDLLKLRENDDMVGHINDYLMEVETTLPKNVKYLGYRFIEKIGRINELNVADDSKKKNKNKKKIVELDSKETYSKLYVFDFELTYTKKLDNGEEQVEKSKIEVPIWIPVLIKGFNYIIKGSKYTAPLQIIDSIFFSKANTLILKVMNRVIKMFKSPKVITDINKNKYYVDCFYLYVAGKKESFLLYYWAHYGFFQTLRYFGCHKYISLVKLDSREIQNPEILDQNYLYFKFGTLFLQVDKKEFNNNIKLKQFVACTLALSKRNLDEDAISKVSTWLIRLSSTVSETRALIKGRQIMNTFMIALDNRTRYIIRNMVTDGEYRQDMHSVIKWFFLKFDSLSNRPINDLNDKRIRFNEYLILPLIEMMTKKIERFCNTADKAKDLQRLEDIFKIPQPIIIYSMNSSLRDSSINTIEYSDRSSDNAYPLVAKITLKGPGTPQSQSKKYTSSKYKTINRTYPGNLSLPVSIGDIGLDTILCPTAKIDLKMHQFVDHPCNIGNE